MLLRKPKGRFSYVAPFLSQAKQIAWEYLKEYSRPLATHVNESELWVELRNGSRIRIHGADNPDRLRGDYLDGVVCDEYGDWRPSVWGNILRPMLTDRGGWAVFIGTPKGRNEFYDRWREGNERQAEWFCLMLKASQSGILPLSELIEAQRDMTDEQYEQEFECSFDAAILGSYYGKEIAKLDVVGQITNVTYDTDLPVHTVWDLGIGDSTAIWFFQVCPEGIRIVDSYENNGEALAHYVDVINSKLKENRCEKGDDWLPHDARVKSLETGRTRVQYLISLDCKPRIVSNQKVEDGINAARLVLPHCWFDEQKCKQGLEALRQYRADFDESKKVFGTRPRHDWSSHYADAFRYLALAYKELKTEVVEDKPVDYGIPISEIRSNLINKQSMESNIRR